MPYQWSSYSMYVRRLVMEVLQPFELTGRDVFQIRQSSRTAHMKRDERKLDIEYAVIVSSKHSNREQRVA